MFSLYIAVKGQIKENHNYLNDLLNDLFNCITIESFHIGFSYLYKHKRNIVLNEF